MKIATFDLIPVDGIMSEIEELFEGKHDYKLSENFSQMEYKTTDPVQNLQINFLVMLGVLLIPFLIKIAELIVCKY